MTESASLSSQLLTFLEGQKFGCVLADPFREFQAKNLTDKDVEGLAALPVAEHMEDRAHCYLWVPNSLLPEGMKLLQSWGFKYTSNVVWQKAPAQADTLSEGGDIFTDVTELLLFGIRGKNVRTLAPARSTVNFIQPSAANDPATGHKPDAQYRIIEGCSWGPFLELFGQGAREGWTVWSGQ